MNPLLFLYKERVCKSKERDRHEFPNFQEEYAVSEQNLISTTALVAYIDWIRVPGQEKADFKGKAKDFTLITAKLVVENENFQVNLLQPPWPPKDGIHVIARRGRATEVIILS
ncbi:hypothetical protein ACFX2I_030038 [Malus domestica]